MKQSIYTIGHSAHPLDRFFELLHAHGINAVCDVRSRPYSRLYPQFNREYIDTALLQRNICYRFLGKELGARSEDPSCYEQGKVQYDRIARTPEFGLGLQRVRSGVKNGFRIALMCAEKEPLECHRTILVARHLIEPGVGVQHIHADGRLETHDAAMDRLAAMLNVPLSSGNLFYSRQDLLAEVYRQQEARIAFEVQVAARGAGG